LSGSCSYEKLLFLDLGPVRAALLAAAQPEVTIDKVGQSYKTLFFFVIGSFREALYLIAESLKSCFQL
jgi:hypothetical protein